MTDNDYPAPAPAPTRAPSKFESRDIVKIVYALYLVGFFLPLCALAGLVLAYAKRGEADPVSAGHFEFQIRSFWIGLAACVVGGLLAIVLVGYAVLAIWVVWALTRFITGLLAALDDRPVRDPEGFSFIA